MQGVEDEEEYHEEDLQHQEQAAELLKLVAPSYYQPTEVPRQTKYVPPHAREPVRTKMEKQE